jgi:hypothetical protein
MLLEQWVNEEGPGAIVRLQVKTGLSYTAVQKAVRRTSSPDYETARRISEATKGQVSIAEICGTPRRKLRTKTPATKAAATKPRKRSESQQLSAAARRA